MTTITINRPGLSYALITVTAESRAVAADQTIGRQNWRGLAVDGVFYPLVLCKHVNANPLAMIEAVDAALSQVQAAIESLKAPAPITKTISYDRASKDFRAELDGELVGYFGSYHEAEVELDRLVSEQLSRQVYARPAEEVEMVAAPPTRTVTIPSCAEHGGFEWNKVTLTLKWICPKCGGARGEPFLTCSYDGSRRLAGVHGWRNPCGHVDGYGDVRAEAQAPPPEPYDDTLHIPVSRLDGQCGDCDGVLNEHGQCERCIKDAEQTRDRDAEADGPLPWAAPDRPRTLTFHPSFAFSIKQPPRCPCGQNAIISESAGLFCNGCHEGYTLFEMQKHDPTALVGRLMAEPERRDEMVARVARYLSHKHRMEVSPPTVLIIWRELLSDYEGPDAPLSLMLAP